MKHSFEELARVDIRTVSKEDLFDVSELTLDPSVPKELRAAKIIQTIGNPYCFRLGGMGIKLEFADSAPSLQDIFSDFLQRKKSGA